MFWKFATTSNIDTILDREDVTLREVMDDDDILQECKGQNTKLVKFLCQLEVMEELVSLIITDPSSDADEALKYKYPNIACEILTSDVPQINDMLGDTESLREKLFSFLDNESVLNPLLASFFSKVVGILLSRKPQPTLDFIKSKQDFLGSVLKHLGTSAIMDLLLRLVTCVESEELRAQILAWLNESQLVERLIGLIDPTADEEFHCNSSQSLCDIIRLSREHMYTMQESAQEDPLLSTLERKETVQLLLQHMFGKEINESVIVNGISVLLALLEIRRPAPFGFPEMAPELTQLDVERLASGVSKTLHGLSDHLGDFHKLLDTPPQRDPMHCTFGELNPPLGNTRLHVGKLLSAILITNTHNINVQLSELQIFNVLLDLFFRYEYNNFLHTQVVQCIQTVLSNAVTISTSRAPAYTSEEEPGANEEQKKEDDDIENPRKVAPLLTHLFEDCRLIQRILDAWEDNKVNETESGGHRKGNMGHLTIITNQIVENMEKGTNADRIRQFIEGMPEEDQGRWEKFVTESLAEMNDKNSRELGGHNPMHFSSDDDADTDYNTIPFTGGSAQQAFTEYQLQQITSAFIDQFGFTDGDFADQDDASAKFDKINSIDFSIKADTDTINQELVQETYHSRIATGGDSSDEESNKETFDPVDEGDDEWDIANNANVDSPFKYGSAAPTVTIRPRSDSTGSSSSDEGDSTKPPRSTLFKIPVGTEEMDVNSQEWRADFDGSDASTSSGSSNSTPNTSPRDTGGASANADFEPYWTNTEVPVEDTKSSPQEGWANFGKMEEFQSNPQEEVFESVASSSPEETHLQDQVEFINVEDKPQTEKMEIGVEVCLSEDTIEKVSPQKSTTSLSDVVMDIQEEPDVVTPVSSAGEVSTSEQLSVPREIAFSLSPETVAMETDEECPPAPDSSDSTSKEEPSRRLSEEEAVNSSSSPSQVPVETETSQPQESAAESTEIPSTASIKTSTEADAGNIASTAGQSALLHIEGPEDVASDAPTSTDFTSADNGDGLGAPAKTDSEVQCSDAAQVQMNGPV